MAGAAAERQETAFVDAVNKSVKMNGVAIKVKAGLVTHDQIVGAEKFEGRQVSGSEPYIDVNLLTYDKKTIGLSMKGDSAPSLAGGGMRGINLAVPGLANKFMEAAHKHLSSFLSAGDKVPDVYGKIARADKVKIVVGNKDMGGPIDFMYIGNMNPTFRYDQSTNTLMFNNGKFFAAVPYATDHDLYFRLRSRREDQRFDPNARDRMGIPKVYGKSPSKGDSAGRIVVTDKVPSTATGNIVRL